MHPILIAGVALAGLPILLHLIMKQEPKKLLFPAIRFLVQKQRTNQRKMRLRHILLLLLRVLLIALFAVTLWQPKLAVSALDLTDDQPVAAVLLVDTSASMGYMVNGVTRLDDARRRANEFLAELPTGSKVVVMDTNDVYGVWEPTVGDAKRKVDAIREPSGYAQPVTSALAAAYQLFATADDEGTEPENRLPRVLAVFGDRANRSWDSARVEDLKKARDAVTAPAPVHLFFDVGTDTAANVAITSVEMTPQLISPAADAVLTVTVKADGAAVPSAEVSCALDDTKPDRKEVAIPTGGQQAVSFTYKNLSPGFHAATVRIRDDNLAADNVRHFVFQVAQKRKILTVADDPDGVRLWALSHNFGKQEFDCTVVKPNPVPDFAGYEAVCLISVADPSDLWPAVKRYAEAGGKVFVAPPGLSQGIDLKAYNDAFDVLPGKLVKEHKDWRTVERSPDGTPDRTRGVTWAVRDDRDLSHPFLAPFRDWRKRGNVDILRDPRRAWRYWDTETLPGATVAVHFDDADDTTKRSPALLERTLGMGKVLLITTRVDDPPSAEKDRWNDYWAFTTTWPTVFPNIVGRYLVGSPEDAVFNFTAGQDVTVPLPKPDSNKARVILVEGPGVVGRDARPEIGASQADLRVTRPTTLTAGIYTVRTEDRKWEQRFALNVPVGESVLDKVPEEAVTGLFGPGAVVPVGKNADLKTLITTRTGQPLALFPWLLILMLLLFAAEGLFANRFYRAKAA